MSQKSVWSAFILVSLTLTVISIAAASDWPRFRGPNGLGVSETTGLPLKFGPSKNVVWKTKLPPGKSSPALTEDRIFSRGTKTGSCSLSAWIARPDESCGDARPQTAASKK